MAAPPRSAVRNRIIIGIVVALALGAGGKYGRYFVFPKRFAVVEPGQIFRGGEQESGPYQRIVRDHRIRTIVTLLDDRPDDRQERAETRVLESQGANRIRSPMPGDGRGSVDDLDRAADALADPQNRPVFVHCAAGVHRTGASIAAYRMKYRGWDYDRAMAELGRHWVTPQDKPELFEHLKRYYRERIVSGPDRVKHERDAASDPPAPERAPQ